MGRALLRDKLMGIYQGGMLRSGKAKQGLSLIILIQICLFLAVTSLFPTIGGINPALARLLVATIDDS